MLQFQDGIRHRSTFRYCCIWQFQTPFRCVAIPARPNQAHPYRNSDILYLGALQFQRFIIRRAVIPCIQIRRTAIPVVSPIRRVAITGVSYPTRGNSNIAEPNALLHHGCYSKTLRFQNFPTRDSNAFTFGVRRFRNSIVRKFSVSQFLGFYRRSIQIYLFLYLSTSDGILFLPHKRTDRSCATNNTSKIRRSK